MKVEQWKLEDVTPYENNPRKNNDAVEYVANSIKEFGFQQPLVVDSDGVLIVGHTRLKAAELLGLETVPVVVAGDLTEEQVRAYRLADNKTAELADWDFPMLNEELAEIDWTELDMSQFGFKLDDEFEPMPDELDADVSQDEATATVRFYSYQDYKCCIEELKTIVEGHGTVSVKMSDENNQS